MHRGRSSSTLSSGDGQVSDALELAIMEMKKGEKAGLAMMPVSKEMPQGEGLG